MRHKCYFYKYALRNGFGSFLALFLFVTYLHTISRHENGLWIMHLASSSHIYLLIFKILQIGNLKYIYIFFNLFLWAFCFHVKGEERRDYFYWRYFQCRVIKRRMKSLIWLRAVAFWFINIKFSTVFSYNTRIWIPRDHSF